MRGGESPRELYEIALVVSALGRHRVLVIGGDRRPVLFDAAPHPVGEDLGRVGHMPDDLDGGPLVELRCTEPIHGDGADDPRDR